VVREATLPTVELAQWDPSLSRLLSVRGVGIDADTTRGWHYIDTADSLEQIGVPVAGTVLAVHGNPTWSYLWRSVIARSLEVARTGGPAWRVVAVDQLEMGWSERTGRRRTLEQRIGDLGAFTEELELRGRVVTLGHDWGGVISLGWATEHPKLLAGAMVLNTAVNQPAGEPIPAPLRVARARGMIAAGSVHTTAFHDTTLSLASPKLAPEVRAAYRSPYRSADRRRGIGAFVFDIPVGPEHVSHARLGRLASDVAQLQVPALMLWGPKDPIFGDQYLDDLITRLPHADVHRFEGAGHLVIEDAPVAESLMTWISDKFPEGADNNVPVTGSAPDAKSDQFTPLGFELAQRQNDRSDAVIQPARHGTGEVRRVSWKQLNDRVGRLAAGLHDMGVRKGDRVSLLITPGATLTAVVYACLQIGAVVVVADAGLGVKGLGRAIKGAWPDYIIGEPRGLAAARALGWPGVHISTIRLRPSLAAVLGATASLREVMASGAQESLPPAPGPSDIAAILYTSGSTGPAKGVVYTHGQLSAVRDVLQNTFSITSEDGLVTGFAPFALLGPALGARSSTPEMDVSSPRTLTAHAVAAALQATQGNVVFLSPAAILNVIATADDLDERDRESLRRVRTVLSTGAPVSEPLLASLVLLMPHASAHAIYGMTECLLVSDITLEEMRGSPADRIHNDGINVGRPIGNVRVRISPLDSYGRSTLPPTDLPAVLGEILISAPHLKDHYDRLWLNDREALRDSPSGEHWHRTGDVGHLDVDGRLWIEGRLAHVMVTASGPIAPVGIEQSIETVKDVRRAAVVGVGPHGLQQLVAVVETEPRAHRAELVAPSLAARVRSATTHPLVAIFSVNQLPTDIRHNSKIDRVRLSAWAEHILAGHRPEEP
jgi:acyl-coenzyme A synthetase/AMP-(fatty) acid ligase/pimeloyl-ACP methyl ester carboxylesterase